MSLFSNLKDHWDDYLARLSQQNKEMFSGGKPSCCAGKTASPTAPGKDAPTGAAGKGSNPPASR